MSHERSDKAWEAYQQAAEKLDHFMIGLSAALTGYLGQRLELSPLGLNASTAELASVVLFGLSMFMGIRRVEWNVAAMGGNQRRLHHGESAGSLAAMAQQSATLLNVGTGDVISRGDALARAQTHKLAADAIKGSVDRAITRAERAYKWRNGLFYAGGIALVASRVLKAYIR